MFFVWLDEMGCDRRHSLGRRHMVGRGSPLDGGSGSILHEKHFPAIAAMSVNGFEVVLIYEETVDGKVLSYIEQNIILL